MSAPYKIALTTPEGVDLRVVNYRATDGVLLFGFLASPSGKAVRSKVGVIFVHGTRGSALVGAGFLAPYLARYGYTAFAINKRNSDINFEASIFEDVAKDLAGAVMYLAGLGVPNIVLIGHSLGAIEATYYVGSERPASVKALVLSGTPASSPRSAVEDLRDVNPTDPEAEYQKLVTEAQMLAVRGKGDTLLIIPRGGGHGQMSMSAFSYLSYRGPQSRCSAVDWIEKVTVPVFLLAHALPDRGVSPEESEEIRAKAVATSSLESYTVKDAGHFYTDHEEEAAKAVADWLNRVGLPP